MKKHLFILALSILPFNGIAQSYDAQVLLLNYEKYLEIKKTTEEIKKGYEILKDGYERINNVASGDYDLHKAFLDGLKSVSPQVQQYYKVAEIINKQKYIVDHYSDFFGYVNGTDYFNPEEVEYLKHILDNLVSDSVEQTERLLMVITASEMNMTDDERMKNIDRIHTEVSNQVEFMNVLDKRIFKIARGRDTESIELEISNQINKYNGDN